MVSIDLRGEIEIATAAAYAAGEKILSFSRDRLDVQMKEGSELVTAADLASEEVIISAIRSSFPGDGILSEEQEDHESWVDSQRCWVIDPLDGTRDFVAGRAGFSVMIGLLINGESVLGVVYEPRGETMYRAARDLCAEYKRSNHGNAKGWVDLKPAGSRAPGKLRLVSSYTHRCPRVARTRELLGIEDELRIGSVGVKVGLIARGERDLYLNLKGSCRIWDACGPEAILREAGGRFTDSSGNRVAYQERSDLILSRGIVATNGVCHAEVMATLDGIT